MYKCTISNKLTVAFDNKYNMQSNINEGKFCIR